MADDRLRTYRKTRTRSLILFLFSIASMIALDVFYGPKALPRWFVVLVIAFIIGSGWVYMGCVLYDWWAWFRNKKQG